MKKEEIEWEEVPLTGNEVREAQYNLDDHKLKILINKNKFELLHYNIDNNIPKSMVRESLVIMKKDMKQYEEKLSELDKKECELSEEEKVDKKIILMSTMKSCKQKIEEKELEMKLNLPSRDLNIVIDKGENELKRLEDNMKVYQKHVRNKTRRIVKPRIQLSEKQDE